MRVLRWIIGALLLVVFGAFTGIVWLAYSEDRSALGEAPLIRADAGPYRHMPEKRGGLAVLNEGSAIVQALDRGPEPAIVEKILPVPKPAPKSSAEVLPAQVTVRGEASGSRPASVPVVIARDVQGRGGDVQGGAGGEANGSSIPADLPDALASADIIASADLPPIPEFQPQTQTQTQQTQQREPTAPAIVGGIADEPPVTTRSITDRPDATVQPTPRVITLSPSELPVVDAPERAGTAGSAAVAGNGRQMAEADARTDGNNISGIGPVVIDPTAAGADGGDPRSVLPATVGTSSGGTSPGQVAAAVVPANIEPSAAPAGGNLVSLLAQPGNYRLQLAAFRTQEQAEDATASLRPVLDGIVAGLDLRIVRAETDNGTFFRVQTADSTGRDGANGLCEALKAAGGDCFVASGGS
ncbi:MAG: SPOR domain-containing protein [Geminicoccaceae bacterium]|nr:SPOR domain-containing protein [Geminicoccaceae bacterium]